MDQEISEVDSICKDVLTSFWLLPIWAQLDRCIAFRYALYQYHKQSVAQTEAAKTEEQKDADRKKDEDKTQRSKARAAAKKLEKELETEENEEKAL